MQFFVFLFLFSFWFSGHSIAVFAQSDQPIDEPGEMVAEPLLDDQPIDEPGEMVAEPLLDDQELLDQDISANGLLEEQTQQQADKTPPAKTPAPKATTTATPTNKQANAKPKETDNTIELNFNELDLKSLISLISKATNTTFLFEDSISQSKKVTLLSTRSFSAKEAYRIFENILDINDYTTIKEGPYVRIIAKKDARSYQTPLNSQTSQITQGDYVTVVYAPKVTSIDSLRSAIAPFLSKGTVINTYQQSNLIILRDTRDVVEKILNLIRLLDSKTKDLQIARFPLQNIAIDQAISLLNKILVNRGGLKTVFIEADPINYALIVVGNKETVDEIALYIDKLDQPFEERYYEFYVPQYAQAADLIKLASTLHGPRNKNGSRVSLVEDARTNRILLIGVKSEIDKTLGFFRDLDVAVSAQSSGYKVFRMNNSNVEEVARTLQLVTKSVTIVAQTTDTPATADEAKNPASKPQPAQLPSQAIQSSANLSIVADLPTNSLVVFASAAEMAVIEKLIAELDVPRPQIFLEVMILEVSLDKSLNLGINWKAADANSDGLAAVSGGGSSSVIPTTVNSLPGEVGGASVGVLGPALTYEGQRYFSYSAFIQATAGDTDFNVVSNPQILTLVNQEASIRVGEVRPFQTSSRVDANNNIITTYDYKEVGVTLKFTAQVGGDDTIRLKVDQSTKNVKNTGGTSSSVLNFTPTTVERNISTNIVTNDQEIVVLGGLISENSNSKVSKNACLGDIPLLGWLFKSKSSNNTKTNLLVYIRPKIVRNAAERSSVKETVENNYIQAEEEDAPEIIRKKVAFGETIQRSNVEQGADIEKFFTGEEPVSPEPTEEKTNTNEKQP